jgi:lysozyme family protein
MNSNFKQALEYLVKSEGGYVDNPKDPGGRTNLGVTQKVWESWVGRESNEKEMRALTKTDVEPLYKRKYWDACRCDDLPTGLDYLVFDFAVNAGVGRSAKTLQSCVGVSVDGQIGNQTIEAIKKIAPSDLIERFSEAKINFYKSLVTFPTFGKGWLNRVEEVKTTALKMVN